MSVAKFEALYELDDNGSWFVRVPQVNGAHSHGRSLAQARSNIREALALVLDTDEDGFEIEDVVRLAEDVQGLVSSVRELRIEAEELQEFASASTADAVRTLSFGPQPLSVRDIAEILGISFQRVQQLRKKAELAGDTTPVIQLPDPELLDLMEALKASVAATKAKAAEKSRAQESA